PFARTLGKERRFTRGTSPTAACLTCPTCPTRPTPPPEMPLPLLFAIRNPQSEIPNSKELPMNELELEIFRAGDYGPRGRWSEADLDRLAAGYDPALHEAPVTLDHAQTGPALG